MKLHLVAAATLLLMPAAQSATIFLADFEGSTAVTGTTGTALVAANANATISNLNAGTPVGSWVQSNGTGTPGAIVDNSATAPTNKALAFDSVVAGAVFNNRIRGNFTNAVDLANGDGVKLTLGLYAGRQGNELNRQVRFSLDDGQAADLSAVKAYTVAFETNNQKLFRYVDTANATTTFATITDNTVGDGFNNPAFHDYLGTAAQPTQTNHSMILVTLEILAGPDNTTVAGTSGALMSIDWNGNGITDVADGDVFQVAIGPRTAGVTSINSFELFYGSSGTTARGAYVDNILVDHTVNIPEPATVALAGLVGLCIAMARQRV